MIKYGDTVFNFVKVVDYAKQNSIKYRIFKNKFLK